MPASKPIEKVAIIGAGGHLGRHFAEEVLKTGKHTVTAITRVDSKTELPDGVKVVKVDYEDEQSLVSALQGQQFLVITLSVFTPPETHTKIVEAAGKAGVSYIMPNSYVQDIEDETFRNDKLHGAPSIQRCEEIRKSGSSYVCMVCGLWYEWSLVLGEHTMGFKIKDRAVTLFDDGLAKVHVTTWVQCGRALAGLVSLPESGTSPSLAEWKNKPLYFASFYISQRDALDSLHRVLGTTDVDWTITHESTDKRLEDSTSALQTGGNPAIHYPKAMYAKVLSPKGLGDAGPASRLANGALGLPKEDLDEATKRAVSMIESGWKPF